MHVKHMFMLVFSCLLLACAAGNEASDEADGGTDGRRSDCIFSSSIRGYRVLDEQNLIVEGSGRRSYHVGLFRRAVGLSSSWALQFESPTGRICSGFSEVTYKGTLQKETIRIRNIRELTKEEVDDLLIQFGKKEPEIKQTPAQQDVKGADVEELDPAADGD